MVSVGGVTLAYAHFADKTGIGVSAGAARAFSKIAGCTTVAVGVNVTARA